MTTLTSNPAAEFSGQRNWRQWLVWLFVAILLAWSRHGAEMNPLMLWRDGNNMRVCAADYFPPDFHYWRL